MEYTSKDLKIDREGLVDKYGTITCNDLSDNKPNKMIGVNDTTPFIKKLVDVALSDVEKNIVVDNGVRYFGAGTEFKKSVFTRDISISGILSLNMLYPDVMMDSFKFTRDVRKRAGFSVSPEYHIPQINAPWNILDKDDPEANVGPITRRSDDVVWIWGAGDWIEKNGDTKDWEWLYNTGVAFFEEIYQYFYDSEDGLYRGQAVFIDVHFPDQKASGYPLSWDVADCVLVKALSTNCAYKKAMDYLSMAAKVIGLQDEAICWAGRSRALKDAIVNNLSYDDKLAYYKDKNGDLEKRQEALGTAFAILCDVVDIEAGKRLLEWFPIDAYGIPLFQPFFEYSDVEQAQYIVQKGGNYHNNTSWPFVDTFFLMAYEKAFDVDLSTMNVAIMARTCRYDGTFHELVDYRDKKVFGSSSQLWTAASLLNAVMRAGIIDKETEDGK